MNHIFQSNRKVYFDIPLVSGGIVIPNAVDFTGDDYAPYISGYISYEPERVTKRSPINGKVFTKTLGWRAKVEIEINLVTEAMVTLTRTLLSKIAQNQREQDAINILGGQGDSLGISISYFSFGDGNSNILYGFHLVSDVSPEYLNKSIMAGEKLTLEFESKELFNFLPGMASYGYLTDDATPANNFVASDGGVTFYLVIIE